MLDMAEVYSSFVREWFEKDIDDNLVSNQTGVVAPRTLLKHNTLRNFTS